MKLKTTTAILAATVMMAAQTIAPFGQIVQARPLAPVQINYQSGDVIPVTLDESLSSASVHKGDTFTATVDTSGHGYSGMRGASVTGHVTDVVRSHDKRAGQLGLQFDSLRTAAGKVYQIQGSLIGLDSKSVNTSGDGTLTAKSSQKHKTLEYAGIGAGAGAVLGILGGGGLRIGTILLGGILGGAAGQLSKGKTQQHDVELKSGTKMGVRLDRDFDYPNY